jgi:hypothetical protein
MAQSLGLEKKNLSESECTPSMICSSYEFFGYDIAQETYFLWYIKVIIMHGVF